LTIVLRSPADAGADGVDSTAWLARGGSTARRSELIRHAAAAGFVAVFVIGHYLVLPPSMARWWADLSWTLVSLVAAIECLRTARTLSGHQRRAWLCFGAGCLAWFAGMLVWDYRELIQRELTPFPDYSDAGFMALAPLYVLGLIYMSARRGLDLTLKDLADLGVIATVVALGSWLAFGGLLHKPGLSVMYRGLALAWPVLHLTAFVFAMLVLLRRVFEPGQMVLLLFLTALGMHAITGSIYAYSLLEGTYQSGHYLDVFWVAAFAMVYSAAVVQQGREAPRAESEEGLHRFNIHMRRTDTLVFTGVLLAAGATAYWQRDVLTLNPGFLAPFLAVLAVFLGLREWANHRVQIQLIEGLRRSERELNRILEYLDDTYYRINLDGVIERVSPSSRKLTGYAPEELIGRPASDFNPDIGARRRLLDALEANAGVIRNYESQLVRKDGSRIWVSTNAHYVRDPSGRIIGIEGTSRDVSDWKAAETEMRKLSGALQQSADSVIISNQRGIIEYVNRAFEETTGFAFAEVAGKTARVLKSGEHERPYYEYLWSTIQDGEVFRDVMVNRRKDGSLYYEDKTITPLLDDAGNITHFVATGKDISEQMETQERLQYIAHHDTLTGLPNRVLFLDRVAQVLAHTRRHDRLAAVLFMDLDQFKNINDSLGHEVGDKLLAGVADRLDAALRPGDTVARFGGDEFVMLLDDVDSYKDVTHVVERLRRALHASIEVDGISLHVTGSTGISVFPHDGEDGPALLKNADNAMYRAKEHGRGSYAFYSEEMSTRVNERLAMENELRAAVDNGEFEIHYQPQIDIVDNTVLGVEALLRWKRPDAGRVTPEKFVPLLEDTGLIIELGERVLHDACAQVSAWNRESGRRLELAVNISARQFADARFANNVLRILADTGLSTELLQLEMTESVYLRTTGTTDQTLHSLDRAGIRFAIDDFGTGYSALSYLKRLPIQVLKIDRSFIRDIPDADDDSALTVAALAMARGLGLRLVAEGVETPAQLEFLREHGCRYVQGFLYSEPVTAAAMSALLDDPGFP
jgi:diguanylate cyclase (GGDEF)-like protein/PAS domain S-box-containing protein